MLDEVDSRKVNSGMSTFEPSIRSIVSLMMQNSLMSLALCSLSARFEYTNEILIAGSLVSCLLTGRESARYQ
jgi:hypothetical protein